MVASSLKEAKHSELDLQLLCCYFSVPFSSLGVFTPAPSFGRPLRASAAEWADWFYRKHTSHVQQHRTLG